MLRAGDVRTAHDVLVLCTRSAIFTFSVFPESARLAP